MEKFGALLLVFFIILASCSVDKTIDRPNVILIFADDLGYGDLGSYGHPTIRTPNLDQMAAEGIRFTQFYTGASVCTPSRAALLTGRLPVRYGCAAKQWRVFFPFSLGGLPETEITLAESLREAGYKTAIFGKWHLGHHTQFLPLNHGFDEYYGIPYSNDMSPATNPWDVAQVLPDLPLIEGSQVIETEPDQRYLTQEYTERATQFIKENREVPFFLYYPHTFPHIPLFANPDFEGVSSRGLYGDVVEEIDWSVGEILRTLKEEGIDQNTLVIFTSDNGPWLTVGKDGGSAGLLHQGKGSTYEGGMRVPAIFRWPGSIPPGQVSQDLATTMDIYPTILSIIDQPLPEKKYDGVDMSPVLRGEENSKRQEVLYYYGEELFALRQGIWKIHFKTINPYIGEQPVAQDPPLLYNIAEDPSERFNIQSQHPDVVLQLSQIAQEHLASIPDDVPNQLHLLDTVMLNKVRGR